MTKHLAAAIRLLLVMAVAVIAVNLLVLALQFQAIACVLLGVAAWRSRGRFRGTGDAYGSARASRFTDLLAAGLLGDDGLLMGDCGYLDRPTRTEGLRALFSPSIPSPLACKLFLAAWLDRRWAADIPIRLPEYVHIGTFAPAGAGKGVSGVIPTLMSYRGSVVVTDPKGENYLKTAEFRRRKFGHKVVLLDPFNVCGPGGGGMNPIALLPPVTARDFINAGRDLANALVFRTGKEDNPHWNDRCEDVLLAIIIFIAAKEKNPKLRNLSSVRRIVSSQDALLATINIMRTMCDGLVKQQGDSLSFLQPGNEEFYGVMSTVQRQTAWMDGEAVADCLSRHDVEPRDLRSGRVSQFLVLPPERLESMASLMRMWVFCTLSTLSRGEAGEANPVLFLIDEAAHLGRLRWLETGLTLLRGYGIRIWLYFQSLGQLKEVYGDKDQIILDNLGTQQYYGITSYESAEAVSRRIGDTTVTVVSTGESTQQSNPTGPSKEPSPGNASTGTSTTLSEHGRRWMAADEILTMPRNAMLLMHGNMHVIPTRRVRYFDSPLFRRGGTGQSRGLGPAGVAAAACVCVVALLLSASLPRVYRGVATPANWSPIQRSAAAMGGASSFEPAESARLDATPRGNIRRLRRGGRPALRSSRGRNVYSGF